MSMVPIASVLARMNSIDSRFGVNRAVPGSPRPAQSLTTGIPKIPFDEVLDDVTSQALGVYARDELDPIAHGPTVDHSVDQVTIDGVTVATSAPNPSSAAALAGPMPAHTPFADLFEGAANRYGVPSRLLAAVGWVESRYQVDALSPDGAIGVMQIMPATARELGVDPTDPPQAIDGAARLLATHRDRFGSWDLALAAYHSGGGAVARSGATLPPRAAEYVRLVNARLETQ